MDFKQEDFLQLSGIQHYVFCKRQWGLIHIENLWEENVKTAQGRIIHENAHDATKVEKRKELVISRALPIHSYELGLSGECDIVEFNADKQGIYIPKYKGTYQITPIEYKRGKPKSGLEDVMQLVAQVMCLEEMFCTTLQYGIIYYHTTRKRVEIIVTDELRYQAIKILEEMHKYIINKKTPKSRKTSACKSCSLVNLCLPVLEKRKSVSDYIDKTIKGDTI